MSKGKSNIETHIEGIMNRFCVMSHLGSPPSPFWATLEFENETPNTLISTYYYCAVLVYWLE